MRVFYANRIEEEPRSSPALVWTGQGQGAALSLRAMSTEKHQQPPMTEQRGLLQSVVRRLEQTVAVLVLLLILWLFAKGYGFFAPIDPIPFEPTGWREPINNADANNPRSRMVDDLLTRLTPGMPKATVIEMLGPPDIPAPPCDYWHLGFRGDMIDPFSLAVCYADDTVTEGRIHQH